MKLALLGYFSNRWGKGNFPFSFMKEALQVEKNIGTVILFSQHRTLIFIQRRRTLRTFQKRLNFLKARFEQGVGVVMCWCTGDEGGGKSADRQRGRR